MGKSEQLTVAHTILDESIATYKPIYAVALFSGGYDSLVTTHVAMSHLEREYPDLPRFVTHINTGIGIEETRMFVREICKQYAWTLKEYMTPYNYDDLVAQYGFPGPAMHRLMYIKLKERPLMQMIREHKTEKHDRILLITGARKQESERRMGHVVPFRREGSRVWVSPLLEWSKSDILDYKALCTLPSNEVVDLTHKSGECLCGAFAHTGELQEIETFYPAVGCRLRALQERVQAAGFPWGWEEEPPRYYLEMKCGQLCLPGFSALCSSCEAISEKVEP
jgi:3'-phosphoadenosine 5'-phosphosulfate sulfotransferase (PAPS reductase)/FAD synthetase